MSDLKQNYQSVLSVLNGAELIAVSKMQSAETMKELYLLGQRSFGENYVQELVEKATQFKEWGFLDVRFHFIGHLQSNKVKQLLPWTDTIHSVDSLRLLQEVNKQATVLQKTLNCYFQVNIDNEESKSGFAVDELPELAQKISDFKMIKPMGLMIIPKADRSPEDAFSRLGELSKTYGGQLGNGKSMGMSDDFELAIRHGATVVRVGSRIFGARSGKAK